MEAEIRTILDEFAKLAVPAATLKNDDNLYTSGLSSFASVQVMLALEEKFDVEFDDAMLNRKTFSTIAAMASAIRQLQTVTA